MPDPRRLGPRLEDRQIERAEVVAKLAGSVVHNFNNILSVMSARVQMLLGHVDAGRLDPRQLKDGLLSMQKVTGDAAELLKRLRELTRPPQEPTLSVLDLNSVVLDAVDFISPHVAKVSQTQSIQLRLTPRFGSAPALVVGQSSALREVLVNLLLNALDAMPAGGDVMLETGRAGAQVVLRVSDTGTGMSPEVLAQAFMPFFTTKAAGSTGLGLSSAKDLITKHGGTISVESRVGRGTTFTIALPASEDRPTAMPSSPALSMPAGLRVLVVEDEQEFGAILREFLSARGCQVTMAGGGQAALDALGRGDYDVILTDVLLPEASGLEIARVAKKRSPRVVVIAMSGHMIGQELRAEGTAVDASLTKPINLWELARVMAELVGRERAGGDGRSKDHRK